MPATATSIETSPSSAVSVAEAASVNALDSVALLQGQKSICIQHNGSIYRLQATKLGKLILTK